VLAVAIVGLVAVGMVYFASCPDPRNPGACLVLFLPAATLVLPFGVLLIVVWALGYVAWSSRLKRLGRSRPWYEVPAVLLFGALVGYVLLLSGCAVLFH
jgi:hypothetical protein